MGNDIPVDDSGEGLKLTAYYSRKRGLPDYSSEEASIFISQAVPGVMEPEELAETLQSLFVYAKSEVYQQLRLPFEQDEVGRIMETFPDTKIVASKPKAAPKRTLKATPEPEPDDDESDPEEAPEPRRRTSPARGRAGGSQASRGRPTGGSGPMTEDDLWEELEQHPDLWYDNRETKRNPKAPDFVSAKHKQPGSNFKVGLWLNNAPDWCDVPDDGFAGQ